MNSKIDPVVKEYFDETITMLIDRIVELESRLKKEIRNQD